MDLNRLSAFRQKWGDKVIFVVGGAGYIGSRAVGLLKRWGWKPVVIDLRIYGQPGFTDTDDLLFFPDDVLQIDVPDGAEPVIWLASMHRDPKQDIDKHSHEYGRLMVKRPLGWLKAGHPILYVSSMSVLTDPTSLYASCKAMFEELVMQAHKGFSILRFGTVWGGLNHDPARPHTAINQALLGNPPDENYRAFTTYIGEAVEAIAFAPELPFLGEVVNIVDQRTPMTLWELQEYWMQENLKYLTAKGNVFQGERRKVSAERKEELARMEHPCEAIRRYYWPTVQVPAPVKLDEEGPQ